MKADISEVEENARREHERERKHEFDSAAYLISMSKQYAEMSKVALPHLLTMSDHLGVDLLHLSGSALSTVFDMKELSSLKSEYEAALGMLRRCKSHIENKEKGEEALAIRCPSGLASLLTGRVPSGIDERPANVTLFDITSHFARLPSSSAVSDWHSSLTEVRSWLECRSASSRSGVIWSLDVIAHCPTLMMWVRWVV
uniref:Uncharacterized protein n=1 Tax=Palpitomonas bilix TaxID=652834 RepID=A0A7S3DIA5_9EUKA